MMNQPTKKLRVYFSRSNASKINDVSAVKAELNKLDIEVIEHSGSGNYSHDAMLTCDKLLILPPVMVQNEDTINIGKGQYEQIQAFLNKHGNSDIWLVNDISNSYDDGDSGLNVQEFDCAEVMNTNWQTDYASIEGDNCACSITYYDNVHKFPKVEPGFISEPVDMNLSEGWKTARTFGDTLQNIYQPRSYQAFENDYTAQEGYALLWGKSTTEIPVKNPCNEILMTPYTPLKSRVFIRPMLACITLFT